jgi:hypothetical protein
LEEAITKASEWAHQAPDKVVMVFDENPMPIEEYKNDPNAFAWDNMLGSALAYWNTEIGDTHPRII